MTIINKLNPTTRIMRSEEVLASNLGDETVMMSLATNNYYGLDEVGSRLWELLEQPRTLHELCAALQAEYDVAPEICQSEVSALVERMVDEQIVSVV